MPPVRRPNRSNRGIRREPQPSMIELSDHPRAVAMFQGSLPSCSVREHSIDRIHNTSFRW